MKTLHTTELQTAVGSRARTAVNEIPTADGPVREISVIADAVLTVAEARQLITDLQHAVAVADGDAVDVPATPTNPADLLRQVAEHAPKVLPERIVKPLLSALTFLAKDGHDSHHTWLAGRLARGVLALPEPSAVPATQDDLREQLADSEQVTR